MKLTLEVGFHRPVSEADFCRKVSEADFDFDSWPHFEAELEAALEVDFDQVDLTCWPRSEAVFEEEHLEADFLQMEAAVLTASPLEAAFSTGHSQHLEAGPHFEADSSLHLGFEQLLESGFLRQLILEVDF